MLCLIFWAESTATKPSFYNPGAATWENLLLSGSVKITVVTDNVKVFLLFC